jgi:hypothetical protein
MNDLIALLVDDTKHYLAVLEAWDKVGRPNVTIRTLTSIDRAEQSGLRDDLPLIPSLQHFLIGSEKHGYLLLATTDNQELLEKLVASAQQIMDDPQNPGEGTLFVVPVSQALRWTKQKIGKGDSRKIIGLFTLLPTFSAMDMLGMVTNLLCN